MGLWAAGVWRHSQTPFSIILGKAAEKTVVYSFASTGGRQAPQHLSTQQPWEAALAPSGGVAAIGWYESYRPRLCENACVA